MEALAPLAGTPFRAHLDGAAKPPRAKTARTKKNPRVISMEEIFLKSRTVVRDDESKPSLGHPLRLDDWISSRGWISLPSQYGNIEHSGVLSRDPGGEDVERHAHTLASLG